MNEENFRSIVEQLRQPTGELAVEVGEKINFGQFSNYQIWF